MIISDLTESVFQQTKLQRTLENAWWVEQMLQFMQINGLVKLINNSKIQEICQIKKHIPNFKWAFRKQVLNITQHIWLYEFLQCLDKNFNWGEWTRLISYTVDDLSYFNIARNISIKNNVLNLKYLLKIVDDLKLDDQIKIKLQKEKIDETLFINSLCKSVRQIQNETLKSWNNIRMYI